MTHISSIGAGLYSDLSVCREVVSALPANEAAWKALFATELANGAAVTAATGEFTRIKNVREFPSMGTPPNIVNVPVYGSKTSQQIQGQADAPTMEITINYVGTDWQDAPNYLGSLVGDGNQYAFRFTLLNSEPDGYASTSADLGTALGGTAGSPACQNSQYYWLGKIEAMQINPQLTDANTMTLTLSVQSEFYGAYTST
jgi:hypothetical protein